MLRIRFLLLCCGLLFSVLSFASPPAWFVDQDIKPQESYGYIGYGEGESIQQAKLSARNDIAAQLLVVIDSKMVVKKELSEGEFSTSAQQYSRQQTFAKLSDLSMIESVYSAGKYFVAMEYQHLSFAQSFSRKIDLTTCTNEEQHPYLSETPLFKSLNKKIGCKLNLQLIRKNKAWALEHNETLAQVYSSELSQMYVNAEVGVLSIKPSSNRLIEGALFDFSLAAKENGYVTLFNVYSDGVVSLLQENISVSAGVERAFPTEKDELVFEAALMEKGKESLDMYVGLFSPTKKNYPQFHEAGESLQQGESQYQFDSLLDLMRRHDFSAVLLRVVPK